MNISYDYYRVFYYVAKYKSFTGAAKALMNNQPNITRMMKKLEEALGCTAYHRRAAHGQSCRGRYRGLQSDAPHSLQTRQKKSGAPGRGKTAVRSCHPEWIPL